MRSIFAALALPGAPQLFQSCEDPKFRSSEVPKFLSQIIAWPASSHLQTSLGRLQIRTVVSVMRVLKILCGD